MPVNEPPQSYTDNAPIWRKCRDVYNGTEAVKKAGELYLPRLDPNDNSAEARREYDSYLSRGVLYNSVGRTVAGLSGLIYQKEPTLTLTPPMEEHALDISLADESLAQFAMRLTREVLITGRCGVLVDMARQGEAKPRPFWIAYTAEQIIGYTTTRIGGDSKLTRVILKETLEERDPQGDEFTQVAVTQYRVLNLEDAEEEGGGVYRQTIYRQNENVGDFVPVETITPLRRDKPLNFIPFSFFSSTGVRPEIQRPPLADLAEINIAHYRESTDLAWGLHYTAMPQPWASGIQGTAGDIGDLVIGPSTIWLLDKGGNAGYLEFTGQGLGALRQSLQDLQQLMATLGARLLETDPSSHAETATAVRMKHAGENATVSTLAAAIETGLTYVMRWHGWWVGLEEEPADSDAQIVLSRDYFATRMSAEDAKQAMLMWQSGAISWSTLWHLLEQGEWTKPDVTAEEEMAELVAEGAAQPPALPVEEEPEEEEEATLPVEEPEE